MMQCCPRRLPPPPRTILYHHTDNRTPVEHARLVSTFLWANQLVPYDDIMYSLLLLPLVMLHTAPRRHSSESTSSATSLVDSASSLCY
jgi:hypothetical protein